MTSSVCKLSSSLLAVKEKEQATRLKCLLARTGYTLTQRHGQRIFEPPASLDLPEPKSGCEVFVGRLPRFILEDELVPIFEAIGTIRRVRIMMDFSGKNRGYAFVTYTNPNDASMAIRCFHDFKLRGKYPMSVHRSVNNCKLFVGGIPHKKTHFEVWNKLLEFAEGIVDVIMFPSFVSGEVNRGYAFVEFRDHRSAAIARRQLGSGMSISLWDSTFPAIIDWADPIPEVDETVLEKITILYIRNIKPSINTHELETFISEYVSVYTIRKVRKIDDYAFVHFRNRKSAEYAHKRLQGLWIEGQALEVSWARPRIYSKSNRINAPVQNFCRSVPAKMRRLVEIEKVKIREEAESEKKFAGSTVEHLEAYWNNITHW